MSLAKYQLTPLHYKDTQINKEQQLAAKRSYCSKLFQRYRRILLCHLVIVIVKNGSFPLISSVGTTPTIIKLPFQEPTFSKAIEFVGILKPPLSEISNMVWSYAAVRIAFCLYLPFCIPNYMYIISDFSYTEYGTVVLFMIHVSCMNPKHFFTL